MTRSLKPISRIRLIVSIVDERFTIPPPLPPPLRGSLGPLPSSVSSWYRDSCSATSFIPGQRAMAGSSRGRPLSRADFLVKTALKGGLHGSTALTKCRREWWWRSNGLDRLNVNPRMSRNPSRNPSCPYRFFSLSREREKGRDGGNNIFDARLLHEGDGRRADNQPVQPTTRSFSSSGSLLRRVFPLIGYVSPLSRPPWIPPW